MTCCFFFLQLQRVQDSRSHWRSYQDRPSCAAKGGPLLPLRGPFLDRCGSRTFGRPLTSLDGGYIRTHSHGEQWRLRFNFRTLRVPRFAALVQSVGLCGFPAILQRGARCGPTGVIVFWRKLHLVAISQGIWRSWQSSVFDDIHHRYGWLWTVDLASSASMAF